MSVIKDKWVGFIILLILTLGVFLRLTAYGDLGLSVATEDTDSYLESSEVNLLSWEAFTSDLPFTPNLLFKLLRPATGYKIHRVSNVDTGTISRSNNPGFRSVAILQTVISLLAWTSLAWFFSSHLNSGPVRILAAGLIILFAITPQVADWDSELGTDSLSISLFVLAVAFLIPLAFLIYEKPMLSWLRIALFLVFFTALFLWTFDRDVNPYAIVSVPFFIFGLLLFPKYRKSLALILAGILVTALFVISVVSVRQRPPVGRNFNYLWQIDIMPYPARVEFFTERGMPEDDTPEFNTWLLAHGDYNYMLFLISHPGYTVANYFEDMVYAFSINMQPYFHARNLDLHYPLTVLGDFLHPESPAVYIVIIILFSAVIGFAYSGNQPGAVVFTWILAWCFVTASITLFLSIFAIPFALPRHALSSTVTFRLLMWLLLFIVADFAFVQNQIRIPAGQRNTSQVVRG